MDDRNLLFLGSASLAVIVRGNFACEFDPDGPAADDEDRRGGFDLGLEDSEVGLDLVDRGALSRVARPRIVGALFAPR